MPVSTIGLTTTTADRRRRAGQRLIIGISGPGVTREERSLIRELQPGGVILFARNIEEPAQVRELNRELRSLVDPGYPLIRCVDQEGGRVQRIKDPATVWPPMQFLGNLDRPGVTARVATQMARELRAMHFDLDFAPVVDVHSNPQNPIIGDRAFGATPERVAQHACAFIEAMQAAGIIACAKHFPGHGDTRADSHLELPVVEEAPDRLWSREVAPFIEAARVGVGTVMTAHVLYPEWDEENPATMSEKILKGMLRQKIGYNGVLISDDLEMKAVRGRYPLEMQLERANRATVDMYLVCKEAQLQHETWEGLIRLQEEDRQEDDRAIDAMARIRALRERFLLDQPPPEELSILGGGRELAMRIRAEGAA